MVHFLSSSQPDDAPVKNLYLKYFQELRAYLLKTFGAGPPEPEDIVQQAFTQYAAIEDKGSISNPRAFLYASVRNLVLDTKRRDKTRQEYFENITVFQSGEYDFSPERVLLAQQELEMLYQTMEKMPKKRRQMLMLRGIDGLKFSEIAQRNGMTEGGVRKHVKHALLECMNALDAMDDAPANDQQGDNS